MQLSDLIFRYVFLPVCSLLLALVLFLLNRQNELIKGKYLVLFLIICVLPFAVAGLLTFTGVAFMPWGYAINQFVFLFIGYWYSEKALLYFSGSNHLLINRISLFLATMVIMISGVYLFATVFNYFGKLDYGFSAATSTVTFLIPLLWKLSYYAMLDIPAEIYKVWKYDPLYQEPVFTSETIDRIVVVELELSKSPLVPEYVKVKAKAPVHFNFGEWFQMFINNYALKYPENRIEFEDANGDLYNWIFYVKPGIVKGRKYIDHEKTIEENGLTEDACVIVCKRVDNNYQSAMISYDISHN